MRRAAAGGSVALLPEVHIRSDRSARFESVGRVILACQEAGVLKVAFLTEPRNEAE